jgi:Rad3-related DNA helicase
MHDLYAAKNRFKKYAHLEFRPYQRESIEFALNSERKIVVLEAATGSGKSLLGMVAGAAGGNLTYLVHSKVLQNQITTDFPEAKSLFGRANYQCRTNLDITCDECTSTKSSPCEHKKTGCQYEERKREVLGSKYKILNYDYFLSEANYVGRFSSAPLIVIDEADSLENTLINFTTLTFTPYALRRIGMLEMAEKLKMTSKFTDQLLDSWKYFGVEAKRRVTDIINKLSEEIESWGENISESQLKTIKERVRIVRLSEKIQLFLDNVDKDWILDNQEEGRLIFRPLWMTQELAQEYLWQHGNKFILMSASFYPKHILAKTLGLDTDDMDYYMVPSQFTVKNRPVYVQPVVNMTAKTMAVEVPKLIPVIKQIAAKYPNDKGIIHAVSYKLAYQIVDLIADPRFITHNSNDRQEVLDKFVSCKDSSILVSPSLERGVSFNDDLCRFIIIAKAPYLSLGNRIISSRLYSGQIGQAWYTATMLLTILQMAGRGVRSKDDYADTYILDAQAKNAITKNPGFLPEWWLSALDFELPELIRVHPAAQENIKVYYEKKETAKSKFMQSIHNSTPDDDVPF